MLPPLEEIVFTYSRSSGSGGQNVNKVNSKVTLKWNVNDSCFLNREQRQRFFYRYQNSINKKNEFTITSEKTRDRSTNQTDCLKKLEKYITSIWEPPKKRISTKVSLSSKKKRLENKKRLGDLKNSRKSVKDD
jgi:ribosome-associated protein